MKIINPATEEVLAVLQDDTADSLAAKFDRLAAAQSSWAAEPLSVRIGVMERFMVLLEQDKSTLAATLTAEMGKPLTQALNEIKGAIARIKWLSGHAAKYLADERMDDGGGTLEERISYEPLGVVCNISAWNYPYLVGVNVFVPALLAGNAVLYKPSEFTTNTGLRIAELLKAAGVPEEVFQVAIGAGDVGKHLLGLSFDGYFFTGSYATGRYIHEQVASKLVPCQLELGGKDPIYVTDDVQDVAAVAAATADGAFYNNGQSCCSVERIYVHKTIYDAYVAAFVEQVKAWKIGDPTTEEDVYFGPLARKDQLSVLATQVADAVEKGATLLTGGKQLEGRGYYFEPTVLVNVNHDMLVMKAESFGPIIGIMQVDNDEEAVALMQDTAYGLTAGVYTPDGERATSILRRMDVGSAYWNCCDRVSAALPWSGRRHSGIGVTLSHQGIRAFTKTKAWHLRG
ncbi:aldehyde dehydrogenase family protein [Parapedobacter koreensis]|uniref:Acyl-CoA reductase n=1 Tax=Parapedobacter koreensis TaxID=332977 RepID=A0A1H7RG88_9SPHI|nr:aldehyde dehydrogenase family protein [Parapedobacter koreensis]SEL58357.1 Acyl-CoA reductase [Parapedobacter koreensis]